MEREIWTEQEFICYPPLGSLKSGYFYRRFNRLNYEGIIYIMLMKIFSQDFSHTLLCSFKHPVEQLRLHVECLLSLCNHLFQERSHDIDRTSGTCTFASSSANTLNAIVFGMSTEEQTHFRNIPRCERPLPCKHFRQPADVTHDTTISGRTNFRDFMEENDVPPDFLQQNAFAFCWC